MNDESRANMLSLALKVVGIVYIVGIYAFMRWMTPEWTWEPRQPEYEQMIMGVYAVLGVFLFLSAHNPMKHASLIWFTIISNIVHAGIMFVQAMADPAETANLYGDIPALFIVAALLAYLMPKGSLAEALGRE